MADIKTIVALAKEGDVVLGTSHLSREEIFELARYSQQEGFDRLLVTHPYFNPPNLSVADQIHLVRAGAMIELCGGNLYPIPGVAKLSNYLETIAKVDARSLVISSGSDQFAPSSTLLVTQTVRGDFWPVGFLQNGSQIV